MIRMDNVNKMAMLNHCWVLIAFIIGTSIASKLDVKFTDSSLTNHSKGSSGTVTARISNVPTGMHIVTAYMNNVAYYDLIGTAILDGGSVKCYNGSLPNMHLRCTHTVIAVTMVTIEVVIPKLERSHHGISWQINTDLYHVELHVTDCGNVTFPGVTQDVPANMGYLSTHTFSCISGYHGIPYVAFCQADATWSLTSFCSAQHPKKGSLGPPGIVRIGIVLGVVIFLYCLLLCVKIDKNDCPSFSKKDVSPFLETCCDVVVDSSGSSDSKSEVLRESKESLT